MLKKLINVNLTKDIWDDNASTFISNNNIDDPNPEEDNESENMEINSENEEDIQDSQ